MNDKLLTPNEEFFAHALVDPTCPSILEAYRRAGYSTACKPVTQQRLAWEISRRPHVAARVAELRAAAAAPVLADATAVLREWVTIATADPGELTRVRRYCCRYCYGEGSRYQWVDGDEFAAAVAVVVELNATRKRQSDLPSIAGGFGYDRTESPNPDCAKCGGDGEFDVYIADTDSLSPAARKLFAGVKLTRNGVEVQMRSQDGALTNIAKYLGMLAERHRVGGDPDNPTPIGTYAIPEGVDPREASLLYQQIIAGK